MLIVFPRLLLIILVCGMAMMSAAQTTTSQTLVVDAETDEPLAYCHIYFPSLHSGTITNQDGAFDMAGVPPGDSVRFSYVGYETRWLTASEVLRQGRIALRPKSILLSESVILGEDSFLYKAVARCRKRMQSQPQQIAKAYFHLESVSNDVPLEMMQCYYNATIQGCHINELALKNGRAALPRPEDGYYVSLNTSKAIVMLDLTNASSQFPANPLQLSGSQCRKRFNLVRLPSYSDASVLHIAFTPKRGPGRHFEGEMWIDAHTFALPKIVLKCQEAVLHPFKPINEESVIRSVAFQVTQSFSVDGDVSFLDHVDFSYNLDFLMRVDQKLEPLSVHTQGLLYLYERGAAFILPYFDYDDRLNDYHKISFIPYDEAFWDETWGFKFTALQLKRLAWLREQGVLVNYKDVFHDAGLFGVNNVLWSEERIRFGFDAASNVRNRMGLHVQLFLDINKTEEGLRYTSATVLDVYRSYNWMEDSDRITCYVNMYFDMAEIVRRELVETLEGGPRTELFARKAYRESANRLRFILTRLTRETDYGRNRIKMREWNDRIRDVLGIDNLTLFLGNVK